LGLGRATSRFASWTFDGKPDRQSCGRSERAAFESVVRVVMMPMPYGQKVLRADCNLWPSDHGSRLVRKRNVWPIMSSGGAARSLGGRTSDATHIHMCIRSQGAAKCLNKPVFSCNILVLYHKYIVQINQIIVTTLDMAYTT
jgi:hypothetical protein